MEKTIISKDYALFIEHLKKTRKKAGLTQEQLAERLGETQSFVSKCERGERRLDVVEVRAFCLALDVPFPSFVTQFDKLLSHSNEKK
jgi:transcriptional regulator with XRE-family HTH domain